MKDIVKKFVSHRYYDYKNIEEKLNNYAKEGLFLESVSSSRWIFRRGEPRNLKYVVTYFSDTSIFDSVKTDGLETYIDYATEYGYTFVTQVGKMQIFATDIENPIPLETDPREQFENIKSCTNKGFLLNIYVLIALFSFNIVMQTFNIANDPTYFFSSNISQFALLMQIHLVLYYLNIIISYKRWCKKCEISLNTNGELVIYNSKFSKKVDKVFLITMAIIFIAYIFVLLTEFNAAMLFIAFVPTFLMLLALFYFFSKIKKGKLSRDQNFAIYILISIVCTIIFIVSIPYIVINFSIDKEDNNGKMVTVNHPDGKQREIEIFSHDIPLTCEDLYEDAESDYYSYEADYSNTLFMKTSKYLQYAYWEPHIAYNIYEPKFNTVYNVIHDDLIDISDSIFDVSYTALDNSLFDTKEAYVETYDGEAVGNYVLFYDDMIITLELDDVLTKEQARVVVDKLVN